MAENKESARQSTTSVKKNLKRRKEDKDDKDVKKTKESDTKSEKSTKAKSKKRREKSDIEKKIKIGKFSIRLWHIYVLIGIVAIFFFIALYGFFSSAYKKPVTKMFKSVCNKKECVDAFSSDVADVIKKADKEDSEVSNALNMYTGFYEDGMEDVGYEILDKTKIRKDKLKKTESEVNQFVTDNSDGKKKDIDVTDGYIMAIKINYKIINSMDK